MVVENAVSLDLIDIEVFDKRVGEAFDNLVGEAYDKPVEALGKLAEALGKLAEAFDKLVEPFEDFAYNFAHLNFDTFKRFQVSFAIRTF